MYKALIIGCGNIGAMYDFETESVSTYAKAFHLEPEIEFEVYDVDPEISGKVSKRYGVRCLNEPYPETYKEYDIIAICTPTRTHYDYLSGMLESGPRLIICEKPVDSDRGHLRKLLELYEKSDAKVLVNFFRRFQPKLIRLKREISDILDQQRCINIVITYQRGFHNNASHAIDLLEFLFNSTIDLSKAHINSKTFDEFDIDPTMSISCVWNGANVQFIGLANAEFSHFEIGVYFTDKAVLLVNAGDTIKWFTTTSKTGTFYPKLCLQRQEVGAIENYMINVVDYAKRVLDGVEEFDNFLHAMSISDRVLQIQGN